MIRFAWDDFLRRISSPAFDERRMMLAGVPVSSRLILKLAGSWTKVESRRPSLFRGMSSVEGRPQDGGLHCGEGGLMVTAAGLLAFDAVRADEFETVRDWRYWELRRAGFDEDDATDVAFHLDVDLHLATDLVRRGCPSALAARIVL
jgi:hypothetical protein